jgi:hypothetical protein
LADLRSRYDDNVEFGRALEEHGININHSDRAALIWMGQLPPAVLEDALALCERRSPQNFRREVEALDPDYFKPSSCDMKTDSEVLIKPAAVESALQRRALGQFSPRGEAVATVHLASQAGMSDRPRAKEVAAVFTHRSTRGVLAKLHKLGWTLVLKAIDAGWATSTDTCIHRPNARLLLPFISGRTPSGRFLGDYDLSKKKDCERAERELMSCVEENIDQIRTDPDSLPQLFHKWRTEQHYGAANDTVITPGDNSHIAAAVAKYNDAQPKAVESRVRWFEPLAGGLPDKAVQLTGESLPLQDIKVCGMHVYPSPVENDLTYTEALVWSHYIMQMINVMGRDMAAKDIGLQIAQSGQLVIRRAHPELGALFSAIGGAIRHAGGDIERGLACSGWFDMAGLPVIRADEAK